MNVRNVFNTTQILFMESTFIREKKGPKKCMYSIFTPIFKKILYIIKMLKENSENINDIAFK